MRNSRLLALDRSARYGPVVACWSLLSPRECSGLRRIFRCRCFRQSAYEAHALAPGTRTEGSRRSREPLLAGPDFPIRRFWAPIAPILGGCRQLDEPPVRSQLL